MPSAKDTAVGPAIGNTWSLIHTRLLYPLCNPQSGQSGHVKRHRIKCGNIKVTEGNTSAVQVSLRSCCSSVDISRVALPR